MDRICPYLVLADDGRTVVDGFDPEHRCHAMTPPAPLERARQVQLCLTEAHVRCERFAAARTAWLAASSGLPRVAPDVAFGRTRLTLEPEAARRGPSGSSASGVSGRTLAIGGVGAVLVVVLLLGKAFGILGAAPRPTPSPTPLASFAASETAAPTPSPSEPPPTVAPTVSPSAAVATATPGPTPHIYFVQSGDTLNSIAKKFNTTAQAIAAASGIKVSDTLTVGQRLVIP